MGSSIGARVLTSLCVFVLVGAALSGSAGAVLSSPTDSVANDSDDHGLDEAGENASSDTASVTNVTDAGADGEGETADRTNDSNDSESEATGAGEGDADVDDADGDLASDSDNGSESSASEINGSDDAAVLVESPTADLEESTSDAENATNESTPVGEAVDTAGNTTSEAGVAATGTVSATGETTDDTADSLGEASKETTDAVDSTANETTAAVDSTANETTDAVDEITNETTADATAPGSDSVENATGAATETGATGTDRLENATNETTDAADETTGETTNLTDAVLEDGTATIDETADVSTDAVDNSTALVDEATGGANGATETTTTEATGLADDATNSSGDLVIVLDDAALSGEAVDSLEAVDADLTAAIGAAADPTTEPADGGTESGAAVDEMQNPSSGSDADVANATAAEDPETETTDRDETDRGLGFGGGLEGTERKSATDAALVGLLGVLTASGAAAGGASSGATGAATAGASASASAIVRFGWLRRLWQLAAAVPFELFPIFKYSRYDDSDPLENERRRAVFETVETHPGSYLSEVSERSGVSLSTVRHHLRVLEDERLLTSVKVHGKRRYFPTGADDAELHAALDEPAKRNVLEALAALGRAHNGRIANELDRDPSTVSHHLAALEESDLVRREREGRAIVNELAPAAEAALLEGPPVEPESKTTAIADD